MQIAIAGEGVTDLAVMRRLVLEAGLAVGRIYWGEGRTGKYGLDRNIAGWAAGARFGSPIFVLRDLDQDAPCASALRGRLCSDEPAAFVLRIATKAVEAWLIADRDRLAKALSVSPTHLPNDPDSCEDPKAAIIAAARKSKSAAIRRSLPPRPTSGRKEGDAYAATLIDFVGKQWRPMIASGASDSLARTRRALAKLSLVSR